MVETMSKAKSMLKKEFVKLFHDTPIGVDFDSGCPDISNIICKADEEIEEFLEALNVLISLPSKANYKLLMDEVADIVYCYYALTKLVARNQSAKVCGLDHRHKCVCTIAEIEQVMIYIRTIRHYIRNVKTIYHLSDEDLLRLWIGKHVIAKGFYTTPTTCADYKDKISKLYKI